MSGRRNPWRDIKGGARRERPETRPGMGDIRIPPPIGCDIRARPPPLGHVGSWHLLPVLRGTPLHLPSALIVSGSQLGQAMQCSPHIHGTMSSYSFTRENLTCNLYKSTPSVQFQMMVLIQRKIFFLFFPYPLELCMKGRFFYPTSIYRIVKKSIVFSKGWVGHNSCY